MEQSQHLDSHQQSYRALGSTWFGLRLKLALECHVESGDRGSWRLSQFQDKDWGGQGAEKYLKGTTEICSIIA